MKKSLLIIAMIASLLMVSCNLKDKGEYSTNTTENTSKEAKDLAADKTNVDSTIAIADSTIAVDAFGRDPVAEMVAE